MKKENLLVIIFLLLLSMTVFFIHLQLQAVSLPVMATAVKDSRSEVALPVLMYHGITENPAEVTEYFITAAQLEGDLQWLQDHGYTTVSVQQLSNYAESGAVLPEKPVLITFDDGYCNNYTLAFPLLQKYQTRAVISLIGADTDASSSVFHAEQSACAMSWGEAEIMAKSGLIEIGSHTYDLHRNDGTAAEAANVGRKGADRIPGESFEAYRTALLADIGLSQQRIEDATGQPSIVFAWPFGAWPTDGSANPILKELGFKASLTSYQIMNTIRAGDPDSLFGLKRFLRTPEFVLADHLPS